jgi:hypothetical protein
LGNVKKNPYIFNLNLFLGVLLEHMLGKLSDFQTHTLTSPALLSAKDLELNFIFNLSVVSVQACHCQVNLDIWEPVRKQTGTRQLGQRTTRTETSRPVSEG